MTKSIFTLLIALTLTNLSIAQGKVIVKGSKNVTSKITKIDTFKRLILNENFKITLEKGAIPKVTVETDDNIHKFVEANVSKDGTLDMFISAIIRSKAALNVTVTYVDGLDNIEIKDNAEITSNSELKFDEVTLKTSGNSKTTLSLKAEKLNFSNEDESNVSLNVIANNANLELNGQKEVQGLINAKKMNITVKNSAAADFSGEVEELSVNVNSGAKFNGTNLNVKDAILTSGMESDVKIKATDNLSIETTGSSNITVSENPKISIKGLVGTMVLNKM